MSIPAPAPPSPLPAPRRLLILEMWQDSGEIVKAILVDVVLWLLALGALFLAYLILHEMEKAGYPPDKSARIEEIHYWGYLAVHVLFAART